MERDVIVLYMIAGVSFSDMLPISVPGMYLCKFLILSAMLFAAVALENLALAFIGMKWCAGLFLTMLPCLGAMCNIINLIIDVTHLSYPD